MMIFQRKRKAHRRLLSCLTYYMIFALLLQPNISIAAQLGGVSAAAIAAQNAAIASMAASTAMMGTGTSNMATGESTQNMAQMALGALQILMSLLGMLASAAAGDQAKKGKQNASNLSGLSPYNPASYPGAGEGLSSNPSNASSNNSGGSSVIIAPLENQQNEIKTALASVEKAYGLPADKVIDALKSGMDPKEILASAPKNTPSRDLLGKLEAGIRSHNGGANASAERLLASANSYALSAGGSGLPSPSVGNSDDALKETAGKTPKTHLEGDENLDADGAIKPLSPELKAALAAKADQQKSAAEKQEMFGWNIFQLVHNRYKKLEVMLYGRVERTNPNPAAQSGRP